MSMDVVYSVLLSMERAYPVVHPTEISSVNSHSCEDLDKQPYTNCEKAHRSTLTIIAN